MIDNILDFETTTVTWTEEEEEAFFDAMIEEFRVENPGLLEMLEEIERLESVYVEFTD
jgi:hypothetical protein